MSTVMFKTIITMNSESHSRTLESSGIHQKYSFILLKHAERRYSRARQQILLLGNKLSRLQARYQKAVANGNRAFRYKLRMEISVLEGIVMVYHQYYKQRAQEVAELSRMNAFIYEGDSSDTDDED